MQAPWKHPSASVATKRQPLMQTAYEMRPFSTSSCNAEVSKQPLLYSYRMIRVQYHFFCFHPICYLRTTAVRAFSDSLSCVTQTRGHPTGKALLLPSQRERCIRAYVHTAVVADYVSSSSFRRKKKALRIIHSYISPISGIFLTTLGPWDDLINSQTISCIACFDAMTAFYQ